MAIDAWMQHPTPRFLGDPMFDTLRRWTGDAIPDEIPLDGTLAAMDAGDVELGLISAWHGPRGALIGNDEVAGWVAAAPERLRGVAAVDLDDPVGAVHELRRCVEELGFVALRVVPWLWDRPPNHRSYWPLYVACCELEIPFCTQVGHTGPRRPSEPGRPIPYLDEVALAFPELTIVAGHIGHPWTEEMLALAHKYERVWIDTSAYTVHRYPEALIRELRRPHHRILFGTNFPMLTAERCLTDLDGLDLDAGCRERFLSGNARTAFGLGG